MSLSAEAVNEFLSKKLDIPDWKLLLKNSKLEFLQKLTLAFGHHVYFQNVSFSALSVADRKCPTPEEAIEVVMNQSGGCCIHNNFVIKFLLETLGFDSFVVSADIPAFPDVANSHVVTIVRLNQDNEEQVYAIDVGFARPILNLIPLHSLPFRGKVAGYEFELRLNAETGNYERILFGGCSVFGKLKEAEGGERVDYVFNLTPKPFKFFNDSMTKMFVDPESKFVGNIFVYRLLRVESPDDFEYVTIVRKTMMHGTADSVQETVFQSYEEMRPILEKYFPNISQKDLTGALANYQKFEDDHPGLELVTV